MISKCVVENENELGVSYWSNEKCIHDIACG